MWLAQWWFSGFERWHRCRLRGPYLIEAKLDSGLLLQSNTLNRNQVFAAAEQIILATMVESMSIVCLETGEVVLQVAKGRRGLFAGGLDDDAPPLLWEPGR